jgi:hypothetical protein
MQMIMLKKTAYRYILFALITCIATWILTLLVYPYLNTIVHGLSRYEAMLEIFNVSLLIYDIAILFAYFSVNCLVSIWVFNNNKQALYWGGFLGVYIAAMYMPSYRAHSLSEWLESHLPKALALLGDVFLLVGVPLLVAFVLRIMPICRDGEGAQT